MNKKTVKACRFLGFSVLMLLVVKTSAEPVRWEFNGLLDSTWGSGNSQPGMVVGATITGFIASDTTDFHFVTSYQKFDGTIAIYQSYSAVLSYTVGLSGDKHTYNFTNLDVALTDRGAGNSYRLEFDGPFLLIAKDVYGSSLSNLSVQSFFTGMATGLSNAASTIVFGDHNWINSVEGHLMSLDQVPEPLNVSLSITTSNQNVILTWPQTGTNVFLVESTGIGSSFLSNGVVYFQAYRQFVVPSDNYTTNGGNFLVDLPIDLSGNKFYTLQTNVYSPPPPIIGPPNP